MPSFKLKRKPFRKYRSLSLLTKGIVAFRRKNFERALRYLEKAFELDPNQTTPESFSYLGQCYLALDRDEEAIKMLSIAYSEFRKNKTLRNRHELREFRELMTAYISALKRTGENEKALNLSEDALEFYRESEKYTD